MPAWTFRTDDGCEGVIVVCGMGLEAAARGAEQLIDQYRPEMVLNVGICGALGTPANAPAGESSQGLAAGDLLRVSHVVNGDATLAGEPTEEIECSPGAWGEMGRARLASVSEPVFEDDRRRRLSSVADVVDMEGFAVAEVCRRRDVEIVMLKGVSDGADGSGKRDIVRNIGKVSCRLAETVAKGLPAVAGQVASKQEHPDGQDVTLGKLMNFAKIEHSVFSLPLLLAGAKLGAEAGTGDPSAWPGLGTLGLIALAGVGARTMGMAMNRVFDRRLDALNPRTARRELPSGRMHLAGALGVAAAGLAVYVVACALLGPLCLMLSPLPAVPLITYSLLKRFTSLCHFGIGLCMALAPMAAFVAVANSLEFTPALWLLTGFTFCWMSGSDIIYALQDLRSDRQTGVRSLPARLGYAGASATAAGVHLLAGVALVMLWRSAGGGLLAGAAMAISLSALVLCNLPTIPAAKRFFPISAAASIAGAIVALV